MDGPAPQQPPVIKLPGTQAPILLVVVDAEEEFDWSGGFDRDNRSVTAIERLEQAHAVFDERGIRPCYVVDSPVAECERSAAVLRGLHEDGRAEIGAHLHPWVCPPFDEDVSPRNSFPGNLTRDLEAAKLHHLRETIEEHLGVRPVVYQAGRYGIGPHTAETLEDEGFEVDVSPSPPFDYGAEGGPDFSSFAPEPYWFGRGRRLLGLPLTGAYLGFAGSSAHGLYRMATHPSLRWARLPAILSRIGAVERLRLSPEGFDQVHLRRLTRVLLDRGVRTFTFSFHAPSLKPGCTPYVHDERDLTRFLDTCRDYFDYFLGDLGGTTMTVAGLKRSLDEQTDR